MLEKVGGVKFEAIFVTAKNHYAIDALKAHGSYSLIKPISIDNLIKAIDIVTELKLKEDRLQDQVVIPKMNKNTVRITIPQLDGFELIDTSDI